LHPFECLDIRIHKSDGFSSQGDGDPEAEKHVFALTWFLNVDNTVKFGLNVIKHHFQPGNISTNDNSFFEPIKLTQYNAVDGSLYASNEQKLGSLLTLKYGLRVSAFQQIGVGKVREYENPEAPKSDEVISETQPASPTLESIEKAYIHYVMSQTGGKKTKAAKILGIDTSTLYRKLNRYGVGE